MLRTIIAVIVQYQLHLLNNCIEPTMEERQNMTIDQLVDILARKTERFTQLLAYKNFGMEYKECKESIKELLAEIELRKKNIIQNTDPFLNQHNTTVQ
jgi:hypothetical protein